MRIGLVTPRAAGPDTNPGSELITAGIRWLLRTALHDVEFVEVDMLSPWGDAEYEAGRRADVLVLCGNPRFDTGDHQWLYAGLIRAMAECGRPMVDLCVGACVPLDTPPAEAAGILLGSARNQEIIDLLRTFRAVVTRDELARRVLRDAGVPAIRLPCSSWWAARECRVSPVEEQQPTVDEPPRTRSRRVLVPIRGVDPEVLAGLAETREIVAVTKADADWCAEQGLYAPLVCDPLRLLHLFAECEEMVSFRIHAAIPAASLGARVVLAAIDSRAQAGEAFGIPWGDYRAALPDPGLALEPINPVPALRRVMHVD